MIRAKHGLKLVSELKLIPASQNRRSGGWSDDDYDVVLVETQKTIWRIFLNTVSSMNTTAWFWGIDYFCAGTRRPYYGQAESKEAATLAFAIAGAGISSTAALFLIP